VEIRVPWLPFPGVEGVALHPLLILYTSRSILPHERIHAEQMARYTWTVWWGLWLLSGTWRVRLEAEAYVRAARWIPAPTDAWMQRTVEKLSGPMYFPRLLRWQNPGERFALVELRRAIEWRTA
jgi:hypothetical protein